MANAGDLQRLQIEDETTNIMDLDGHCLLEVFSHLRVIDLCAVKDSCKRFSALATSTIQRQFKDVPFVVKYSNLILDTDSECDSVASSDCDTDIEYSEFDADIEYYNRQQLDTVLNRFGEFVDELHITLGSREKDFWLLLLNQCTALKVLHLYGAPLDLLSGDDMLKLFEGLDTLVLSSCVNSNEHYKTILNGCKHLKTLNIFYGFIFTDRINPTHELLKFIPSDVENLDVLFGHHTEDYIEHVSQLKNLKNLKSLWLRAPRAEFTSGINALAASTSLELLTLQSADLSVELLKALDKFTKLQKCELVYVNISDGLTHARRILKAVQNYDASIVVHRFNNDGANGGNVVIAANDGNIVERDIQDEEIRKIDIILTRNTGE